MSRTKDHPTLFGVPEVFPARHTDPGTSKAAAREMVASGKLNAQRVTVLNAVRGWPGSTSKSLATRCRLDRYQVARRLPELERAGLVRKAGEDEGGRGVLWWPK